MIQVAHWCCLYIQMENSHSIRLASSPTELDALAQMYQVWTNLLVIIIVIGAHNFRFFCSILFNRHVHQFTTIYGLDRREIETARIIRKFHCEEKLTTNSNKDTTNDSVYSVFVIILSLAERSVNDWLQLRFRDSLNVLLTASVKYVERSLRINLTSSSRAIFQNIT